MTARSGKSCAGIATKAARHLYRAWHSAEVRYLFFAAYFDRQVRLGVKPW